MIALSAEYTTRRVMERMIDVPLKYLEKGHDDQYMILEEIEALSFLNIPDHSEYLEGSIQIQKKKKQNG